MKEYQNKINFNPDKITYSEQGMVYFKTSRTGILTLPLIVVENDSSLEVRDCYLRSMKKDSIPSNKDSLPRKSNKLEEDFTSNQKREYTMQEVCFWVNGDNMNEKKV